MKWGKSIRKLGKSVRKWGNAVWKLGKKTTNFDLEKMLYKSKEVKNKATNNTNLSKEKSNKKKGNFGIFENV